jgi:hypothetical protein
VARPCSPTPSGTPRNDPWRQPDSSERNSHPSRQGALHEFNDGPTVLKREPDELTRWRSRHNKTHCMGRAFLGVVSKPPSFPDLGLSFYHSCLGAICSGLKCKRSSQRARLTTGMQSIVCAAWRIPAGGNVDKIVDRKCRRWNSTVNPAEHQLEYPLEAIFDRSKMQAVQSNHR